MTCNSRGTPGRPHASSQSSSRIKQDSLEKHSAQYTVSKVESSSQGNLASNDQERMRIESEVERDVCVRPRDEDDEDEDEAMTSESHPCPPISRLASHRQSPASRARDDNVTSMSVPVCMTRHGAKSLKMINLLQDKRIQASVTVATLQELDLHSIQNNLNLRIDICHDPELFFQPISGRKGDEKRLEAQRYWSALTAEFQIYLHNIQPECADCRQSRMGTNIFFEPRLPAFFDNLRDIVKMLVPESDHEEVANHLDQVLLMQQVRVGALDAVRLSRWLADLLKLHCAPMRDSTAEAVSELVRVGSEKADMSMFVNGLEKLFGLLEGMKLDIANHQIRSFRYPLIEGTIEFQRDCFSKAIDAGQISLADSQRWYRMECFGHKFECGFKEEGEAAQRFACLVHGLVHLCIPGGKQVPDTLQYDHHRITRLQEDLQDHIQMNLCLAVFNQQVQETVGFHCDPIPMHETLKRRIISLTEDEQGDGGAISDHLDSIGIEITRAAFSMRTSSENTTLAPSDFDFVRTITLLYDVFRTEDRHQTVTKDFLDSLEERTLYFSHQFKDMSTLEISHAQKTWALSRAGKDSVLPEWDEMARKLAHIAVVHWKVWHDICYQEYMECNKSDEQVSSGLIEHRAEVSFIGQFCRPRSVSSTIDQDQELVRSTAFGQHQVAMQTLDVKILRSDGGYAEELDHISESEADIIDVDQDVDIGRTHVLKSRGGRSKGNQVPGLG